MPPKKEKKEKQVNFDPTIETIVKEVDPTEDTYKFVKNVYINVRQRTADDTNRTAAAAQINEAFTTYLGQLDQDFPTIIFDENDPKRVKYSDIRITTYYILMSHLTQNDANLPTRYKQNQLEFHISGWPVAPDDNSFAQWGIFTRAAVEAFQKVFPHANLTAWAVPPTSDELVDINSHAQDEQELSIDASLPAEELVSEHEQQNSRGIGFVSPLPHAEPSPQSVPLQLDNYDFNAWQAPVELAGLLASLKAMHTYGLLLKSTSHEKSNAAMQLAIELTNDLKDYYTASPEEQNKEAFVAKFHNKLHSQDQLMSSHRQYWKVVLANIGIALTCVGLLAVGISLLVRGHGFFNGTHSQNNVNDVEQQFDKSLRVT